MFKYNCELDRIIDGDTVDLKVDLGFHMVIKIRVRLLDVDAPEIRSKDLEEKKRGLEVKSKLEEYLKSYDKLIVETEKTGKFGRWLGTIWKDNDKSVNEYVKTWSNYE